MGQKLSPNCKEKLNNMHERIRTAQRPRIRPDEIFYLLGVRDANFCNTDHVPVWYDSVGNYSWGREIVATSP